MKPIVNVLIIGKVDSGKSTLLTVLSAISKGNHNYSNTFLNNQLIDNITIQLSNKKIRVFDINRKLHAFNYLMTAFGNLKTAMLTISSKYGEYEQGLQKGDQILHITKYLKYFGVQIIICVITKMSLIKWDKQRYDMIKNQVSNYLQNICGFKEVYIVPVDSCQNINIDKEMNKNHWYQGKTLLSILEASKTNLRNKMNKLILQIQDITEQNNNTYFHGKVLQGYLIKNQRICLMPSKKQISFIQLYDNNNCLIPYAMANQQFKMQTNQKYFQTDKIMCSIFNKCMVIDTFKLKLTMIDVNIKLISIGYKCDICIGLTTEKVQIIRIQSLSKKTLRYLKSNQTGIVTMRSMNKICVDKFSQVLGRVLLKDEMNILIGFGEIIKVKKQQEKN